MIGTVIGLIFLVIFLALAWWAIKQLWPLISPYIGEPFATILRVLCVVLLVVLVLWIMLQLLAAGGVHVPFLK
jgi:uncharacterized membrane protein YwzB